MNDYRSTILTTMSNIGTNRQINLLARNAAPEKEKSMATKILNKLLVRLLAVFSFICSESIVYLLFSGRFSSLVETLIYIFAAGGWYITFHHRGTHRYLYTIPPIAVTLLIIVLYAVGKADTRYAVPPHEEQHPFGKGRVLVLVPHEDDDMNLVGCIFSSLAEHNDLYIAFSTNGDASYSLTKNKCDKALRIREALQSLGTFGIKKDHVIFMGYGDVWQPATHPSEKKVIRHWYHAPDDFLMISKCGERATYGLTEKPCFNPGHSYTKKNFNDDVESVISSLNPDTIICIDYDSNPEHRALALTFEKVMGNMLKKDADFHPHILRAFAYSTSWHSKPLFYGDNIEQTRQPYQDLTMEEVGHLRWDERLRVPVDSSVLTRTLFNNPISKGMLCHRSQIYDRYDAAQRIIKSDKVFWWRPSDNLLLHATVSSDNKDAETLNDFVLSDSTDICTTSHKPFDHGWYVGNTPGASVSFTLKNPSRIAEIRIYPHPSSDDCITQLKISLSNGKEIKIKDIPTSGHPVCVATECDELLTGFTLTIEGVKGNHAGLAEVEAYSSHPSAPFSILKLQNSCGNFIYDYIMNESGVEYFSVYAFKPQDAEHTEIRLKADATVKAHLTKCSNHTYKLELGKGEECVIELLNEDGNIVDAALVRNPTSLVRLLRKYQRSLDRSTLNLQAGYNRIIHSGFYIWKSYRLLLKACAKRGIMLPETVISW